MSTVFAGGSYAALMFVAAILAVAATVLALIFIVPEKRRSKLNAFGKFVQDTLNFKYLIVEKILQAFYILATAFTVLSGFFMLFMVVGNDWTGRTWLGGYGLLLMLLGPIVIRLAYELIMMLVLLVKNVISINTKLRNQNGDENAVDVFAGPDMSLVKEVFRKKPAPQPTSPAAKFCFRCGAALVNGRCPQCDRPQDAEQPANTGNG